MSLYYHDCMRTHVSLLSCVALCPPSKLKHPTGLAPNRAQPNLQGLPADLRREADGHHELLYFDRMLHLQNDMETHKIWGMNANKVE